ncbi:ankyrin repeat and SOCS box protein 3 [Aphelenchoides avenae]|nr:ankyrin repeat and SOCS box protein 3 [Aphelenchus avenae]
MAATEPVGLVCRNGDVNLLYHMIQHGRPMTYPDDRRWFPIHEAAAALSYDCAELLIRTAKVDLNEVAHDGQTPLLLACRGSNKNHAKKVAKLLLDNGARVNMASLDQTTPLLEATRAANPKLVELLLQYGADPHARWFNGWTPLHETANKHDEQSMSLLLMAGADIFAQDTDGHTPFYVAAQEGYMPCVLMLIEHAGAEVRYMLNIGLADGCTALMAASNEGYHEVVQCLLENGAEANRTMPAVWAGPKASDDTKDGLNALAYAAQQNHYLCVRALLPYIDVERLVRDRVLDPLSVAALRNSEESVHELLAFGFPTDIQTEAPQTMIIHPFLQAIFMRPYHTPLREATRRGYSNIVGMLIRAGAKMTYTSECYSPFLFAFRNSHDESLLRHYLDHDVDLNSVSDMSVSGVPDALVSILATTNRDKLKLLLKCGLDVRLQNWCGCNSKDGSSLLQQVRDASFVNDFADLMKTLSVFARSVPRCCKQVSEVIDVPNTAVPRLSHLCRVKIRSCLRPSQLLDDRFLDEPSFPPLPKTVRDFLTFADHAEKYEYY